MADEAPRPQQPAAAELTSELDQPRSPVTRRVFLGLAALGVVGIAFGRQADEVAQHTIGDQAVKIPGLPDFLPIGGQFRFYTVTDGYPSRSRAEYRLTVTGLVDRPMTLTYDDLERRPATRLTKDFQCVTGWRVEGVHWTGVRLGDLLDEAGVQPRARALRFSSFDGVYTESLTLEQARRADVIVAYSMLGAPITTEHGGPVRLYVAPMYGYKSIKWLERIEVVDKVEPGYWELEGYDVDAWIGKSNGRDDRPV